MIFKRKKSDDLSAAPNGGVLDEKIMPKIETLYVAVMCFVAACLSFVALEVGARSPLGHSVTRSATFNAIFRRSYNLKIKILVTNVVTGLITTLMLALGDIYEIPYLYVPWLANTMKGIILYEGPTLLGLSYVWLPNTGIAAGTFVFVTFLLFVEELCLWFDVLSSFNCCWLEYIERRAEAAAAAEPEESAKFTKIIHKRRDQIVDHSVAKSRLWDGTEESVANPTIASIVAKSTSSDAVLKLRSTRSSNDSKSPGNYTKTPTIVL